MGSQQKNDGPSDAKVKAQWSHKHHKVWVELCLELVNKGRKSGSCIDKIGYEYLLKEFNKRTRLNYNRPQLKNHWDRTKSEWARWKKLVSDAGLGWDPEKGTVVADDEWWTNWLQKYPKDGKWREEGLEFSQELDVIFGGTITSDIPWAPSQRTLGSSNTSQVQPSPSTIENQGDDNPNMVLESQAEPEMSPVGNGINEDEAVAETGSVHSRRRTVAREKPTSQRRKLSGSAKLGKQLDRLCGAVESRSMTSQHYVEGNTIKECIDLLNRMPEVPRGSKLYLFAVNTFLKKECREAFIALDEPEVRRLWLEHNMELATSGNQ